MAYLRGFRVKVGINLVFIARFLKSVPFGERIFYVSFKVTRSATFALVLFSTSA